MSEVPAGAGPVLLLAPGAGSDGTSPGLVRVARAMTATGLRVVACELDYQRTRRESGRRGRQPSADAVVEEYAAAAAAVPGPVVLGGLSFGGRVATMAAEAAGALGAFALGYPFAPSYARDKPRTAHLLTTRVPVLICQGTRDDFGGRDEVASYDLPDAVAVHWLEGADHSLRPAPRSGVPAAAVLAEAASVVAAFVARIS